MNLFTKQKWTYKHRKQTCGYQREEGDKLENLGLTNIHDYI